MQEHKDIILSRLLAYDNNTLRNTLNTTHLHMGGVKSYNLISKTKHKVQWYEYHCALYFCVCINFINNHIFIKCFKKFL